MEDFCDSSCFHSNESELSCQSTFIHILFTTDSKESLFWSIPGFPFCSINIYQWPYMVWVIDIIFELSKESFKLFECLSLGHKVNEASNLVRRLT